MFILERMFDVRQGLTRDMDMLPRKFFEKPLAKGKYKGAVLDREKLEQMKNEYYSPRAGTRKPAFRPGKRWWPLDWRMPCWTFPRVSE